MSSNFDNAVPVKRVKVRVAFADSTLVVGGYSTVPGLAVHRMTWPEGWQAPHRWVITHRDSGRCLPLGDFPTKADAMKKLNAISGLADWTQPMGSKAFKKKGLGKKVRAA